VIGVPQDLLNPLDHALNVRHHLIIPEPDHLISLRVQPPGPFGIVLPVVRMLATIDLDDQLRRMTEEIADLTANWSLSAELKPIDLLVAKPAP